ncbi:MAG: TonB-dependent receptor [Bacteroides intestinalis]|nr:TonB-dependent receptor [Bacteroides intestinalis]
MGRLLGVSGSWIISNENFFTPAKNYLNNLKIRLSWGQLGNQAGIGLYDHYQYIFVGGQYPFGDSNNPLKVPNASLGGMPAVDRTWETIETYNAGVDFGLLNNRLNGTFDYFIKDNKNMFYAEEFPTMLGTSAPPSMEPTLEPTVGNSH